jgi:hypothetical protein
VTSAPRLPLYSAGSHAAIIALKPHTTTCVSTVTLCGNSVEKQTQKGRYIAIITAIETLPPAADPRLRGHGLKLAAGELSRAAIGEPQ